ncbi:MAG: PEP-CTERM sorting domain-containing protein [Candidatus Brocadiia bacterium]
MRATARFVTALLLATSFLGASVVSAGPLLQVDVEERGVSDLAAGFLPIAMDDGGFPATRKTFANGVTLDIDPVGVTWGDHDRHRDSPTGFVGAELYRDFVFGPRNDQPTGGIDATLSGLPINTEYHITIWGFDTGSSGRRVSDWFVDDALGLRQVIEDYTFDGGHLPTSMADHRFSFSALAGLDGRVVVQGRGDPQTVRTEPAVFLNALAVEAVPEPASLGLLALGVLGLVRRRRR